MEHCDCYKKELVELFIRFLQKEGLTCTLSVFKTEITSLWGTNPSSGKQSKNNEVYKETIEAEDRRLKRPRSPNFQENIKPNTLSNGEAIGLVSHCIYNTSDSHVAGSARRLKWEISPPKSQGWLEEKILRVVK